MGVSSDLISVVMPAFNAKATLADSARSVLEQTYTNLELIIVDDGSTDGTADICAQLCKLDSRVVHFRVENGGVSRARNAGIRQAAGQFIAFLDADDLYAPKKLELQHNELLASGAHIVTTGIKRFMVETGEPKWLGESFPPSLVTDAYRTLLLDTDTTKYVIFNTALAKRQVFDSGIYYDPSLKTGEDWDIWIRMATRYSFSAVNEPLFLYRKHESSATAGYGNWMTLNSHLAILEKNADSSISPEHLQKRRDEKYLEFMGHAAYARNRQELLKILSDGLRKSTIYKHSRLYEIVKDSISDVFRAGSPRSI